jgi:hypothetical protein
VYVYGSLTPRLDDCLGVLDLAAWWEDLKDLYNH